jgi:hypothetical protein
MPLQDRRDVRVLLDPQQLRMEGRPLQLQHGPRA